MDTLSLNKQLKELAINNGLCQKWQDEWASDTDVDGLIDKFLSGIDFYLSTRFISKRQMLLWFDVEDRHRYNILVDERRSILNPTNGIAVGNCEVKIRCNGHSVCKFYACDNAEIDLVVREHAHLFLTLCDKATVRSIKHSGAPAHVYICRADDGTKAVYGECINVKDNFNLYSPDKDD